MTLVSILAMTMLSSCQDKYDTKAECVLQELKDSPDRSDASYQAVDEYCGSLFDKSSSPASHQGQMVEPNWLKVTKGDRDAFFDKNSVTYPEPNVVEFWIKIVPDPKEPGDYQLSLTRIDCSQRKTKYLSSSLFIDDKISETSGETSWNPIVPGRAGAEVYNMVCNQN